MEKRLSPRYQMNTPVLVSYNLKGYHQDDIGYLLDFSDGGAAVYTNRPLSTNRIVNLHLGTTIRGLEKPVPFLVVSCNKSMDDSSYRFKVRVVIKEKRKKNLFAIGNFFTVLQKQFSSPVPAFQEA